MRSAPGKPAQSRISEAALHRAVAGFLTTRLHPSVWWTTFPAGGGGRFRGMMLKRMGLKPGVPDIFPIIVPRDTDSFDIYGIELKVPGHSADPHQKRCHATIIEAGVAAIGVVHSLEELHLWLLKTEIPLLPVHISTHRLQMAIETWQNWKPAEIESLLPDGMPKSDQVGARRRFTKPRRAR